MTPVKVPTVPCADAAPGRETAATNATAAKDDFDMLNLHGPLRDRPQRMLWMPTITFLEPRFPQPMVPRMRCPRNHRTPRQQSLFSAYLNRHGKASAGSRQLHPNDWTSRRKKARPRRADDRREQLQQIVNNGTVEGCRERFL
jgi:hypothetical protein